MNKSICYCFQKPLNETLLLGSSFHHSYKLKPKMKYNRLIKLKSSNPTYYMSPIKRSNYASTMLPSPNENNSRTGEYCTNPISIAYPETGNFNSLKTQKASAILIFGTS